MLGKFDTIGIDCIAMNANDVICVGAEPTTMVDYIAVEEARTEVLIEIAKGLYEGAKIANINIPAGEIAQIPEMIRGAKKGHGLDLVGTCIGLVPLNKIIVGQNLKAGDTIIGLRSSGVHSNGLTMARKALFDIGKLKLNSYIEELGKTVGEELLEPTLIYVKEIMSLIKSDISVKALVHITSDGFLNLTRTESKVGYVIDQLPEPNPIFRLIQEIGDVGDEEMFRIFNMGIGFCVVVDSTDADRAMSILKDHNIENFKIGHVVDDLSKRVYIKPYNLVGEGNSFRKA
jgi:phosphoribosylformylglycinamidine cyclo-ligase